MNTEEYNPIEKQLIFHVESGHQLDYENIEQLFESKKADIGKNSLNHALHALCLNYKTSGNYQDILSFLLTKKADPNAKNPSSGITPLMICARKGCSDLLDVLLKSERIKIDAVDNSKKTALFHAAESDSENLNIISRLIEHKANINLTDSKGKSILIIAIEKGYTETVKFLLAHHADITVKGQSGEDITAIASRRGFNKIIEIIENHKLAIENNRSFPSAIVSHPKQHQKEPQKHPQETLSSYDDLSVQAKLSESNENREKSWGSIDLGNPSKTPLNIHCQPLNNKKNNPIPSKSRTGNQQIVTQNPQATMGPMPPNNFPQNLQTSSITQPPEWKSRTSKAIMDGADFPKQEGSDKQQLREFTDNSQMMYKQNNFPGIPNQQNQKQARMQRLPNGGQTLLKELTPNYTGSGNPKLGPQHFDQPMPMYPPQMRPDFIPPHFDMMNQTDKKGQKMDPQYHGHANMYHGDPKHQQMHIPVHEVSDSSLLITQIKATKQRRKAKCTTCKRSQKRSTEESPKR